LFNLYASTRVALRKKVTIKENTREALAKNFLNHREQPYIDFEKLEEITRIEKENNTKIFWK